MRKEKFYKKISIAVMLLAIMGSFLLVFDMNKIQVYDQIENITKSGPIEYSLVDAEVNTCALEKPLDRTIILRIDDITYWNDLDIMKNMVKEIDSRDYGVSLGVICISQRHMSLANRKLVLK